ncbi:MAG: RelA/SpoT family protein, partial [Beijerinckiaceae bacterium]
IGALVDGLTKIKKLDFVSTKAKQGENFRKLLLAVAQDVRVLLVKLADRLHNMRTLHFVPPEKRKRVAEETLDIYAPLAGRMGMQEMRDELEDISFRNLMPEAYETITKRLTELGAKSGAIIARIEKELKEKLAARGIASEVKGRQKSPYSVWRKMERKRVSFEQLSDIFGFRVIVGSADDCYRALGVVHTTWAVVPGRFKDYISTPKQNDYRSIHTTVIGPRSQRVELQLRTQTMDSFAEYGIAAHALYKDGLDSSAGSSLEQESLSYQWLKRTVALLTEDDNPDEFLEHTKLELFHDQVFCFTPKGRLIALPRSATPIDFAYAVHTDVGHSAVGCKINGRSAPLTSELNNGDEVEIISAKGQVPPAAWESIVVTGKARAAIRRATRDAARRQYAGLGRQIVQRAFERAERVYGDDKVKAILPRLARTSIEDVMADVGRGEMFSGDVLKAVYPDAVADVAMKTQTPKPEPGWFDLDQGKNLKFKIPKPGKKADTARAALPVRGLEAGVNVQFAPESGAVPGDRIIGILTPGQGVTIYPIQSSALAAFENEPERWLDVRWDIEGPKTRRFPARILIKSLNEPGTLAQIAAIIADHDGNIDNVKMSRKAQDFTETTIDLAVWDVKHLNAILSQLRARPVVASAERLVG